MTLFKLGLNPVEDIRFGSSASIMKYGYEETPPSPVDSVGVYLTNNNTALVFPKDLPIWVSSYVWDDDTSTGYTEFKKEQLSADVTIEDLITEDYHGSIEPYYYYSPTLESTSYVQPNVTKISSSLRQEYNGTTYTPYAGYTSTNNYWTNNFLPHLFKNDNFSSTSYNYYGNLWNQGDSSIPGESPYYYTAMLTGLEEGASYRIEGSDLSFKTYNTNASTVVAYMSVLIHDESQFIVGNILTSTTCEVTLKRYSGLSTTFANTLEFIAPSSILYISFLVSSGDYHSNSTMYGCNTRLVKVTSLYDTNIYLRYDGNAWNDRTTLYAQTSISPIGAQHCISISDTGVATLGDRIAGWSTYTYLGSEGYSNDYIKTQGTDTLIGSEVITYNSVDYTVSVVTDDAFNPSQITWSIATDAYTDSATLVIPDNGTEENFTTTLTCRSDEKTYTCQYYPPYSVQIQQTS